jgi:tetratricopeptide (TPR) repeat protein
VSVQSQFGVSELPELVRDLYENERTGVLTHRSRQAARRIVFSRGLIQYGESSVEDEGLGSRLVRERLVSTGALAEALPGAIGTAALAHALINRGLIRKEPLHRVAREVTTGIVRTIFAQEHGAISFEESTATESIHEADVPDTLGLILNGFDALAGFGVIRDAMGSIRNPLRMKIPSPIPLERLALTRTQGYVISRIDGSSCLADVLPTLPSGEEDGAVRFLFGLLTLRALEYVPPIGDGPFRTADLLRSHAGRAAIEAHQEELVRQAYARCRAQTPSDILGVPPDATRGVIERAYAETKELLGRDRLSEPVRERCKAELAVIESRLVEAYLHLTQAARGDSAARPPDPAEVTVDSLLVRPEMDKTRSRVALEQAARVAEGYHAKARQAARSGDFHNAIQYAKLAISYTSEDARLYYLLADCQVRNPEARWQRMAEENYTRAAELDPWNVEYRISLGRFYKKRGLALRARRQFEEALKLVPEHDVAVQELRGLK